MGVDGLFLEVHDNPAKALSDGSNALDLAKLRPLLVKIMAAQPVLCGNGILPRCANRK